MEHISVYLKKWQEEIAKKKALSTKLEDYERGNAKHE
jgi:hypothetical protein